MLHYREDQLSMAPGSYFSTAVGGRCEIGDQTIAGICK